MMSNGDQERFSACGDKQEVFVMDMETCFDAEI
jgi:hypothetical protein